MGQIVVGVALVMRISGASGTDPHLMEATRIRLAAILAHAGVELEWRECGPTPDLLCGSSPEANQVVLRVLSGPPTMGTHACGTALVPAREPGHFASVFVDCVAAAASELRVPPDAVLACAIAHEIGHLLLGSNSHGPNGLMQVQPRQIDWDRATHNALRFTSGEARKLQLELERRIERQVASTNR